MLRILDKREQGRISRFEQMEDLQRIKDKGIVTKEEIDRHSDYVIDGNCQKAVQYGDYYVFRNQNAQRN